MKVWPGVTGSYWWCQPSLRSSGFPAGDALAEDLALAVGLRADRVVLGEELVGERATLGEAGVVAARGREVDGAVARGPRLDLHEVPRPGPEAEMAHAIAQAS